MLLKFDWQKDIVYLIQFPRIRLLPSVSPYALKMETYLRMANIDYEVYCTKLTELYHLFIFILH
jgi:hypothetical protein